MMFLLILRSNGKGDSTLNPLQTGEMLQPQHSSSDVKWTFENAPTEKKATKEAGPIFQINQKKTNPFSLRYEA